MLYNYRTTYRFPHETIIIIFGDKRVFLSATPMFQRTLYTLSKHHAFIYIHVRVIFYVLMYMYTKFLYICILCLYCVCTLTRAHMAYIHTLYILLCTYALPTYIYIYIQYTLARSRPLTSLWPIQLVLGVLLGVLCDIT